MKKTLLLIFALTLLTCSSAWGFGIETLIDATTAAGTREHTVPAGHASSLQLIGTLSGAEEITLERWVSGTTWEALEIDGSAAPSLSDTNHVITIYGGLKFRISKPATAAAAGVIWVK